MCGSSSTSEFGDREAVTIATAVHATGMSRDAIAYYERAGVLPRPTRCGAGHRRYRADDLGRLRLVRRLRDLGIASSDIGRLLWGPGSLPPSR